MRADYSTLACVDTELAPLSRHAKYTTFRLEKQLAARDEAR
jgi:hypothetical protein